MKVIITGASGMVGEGVLIACINHPEVAEILLVNRKSLHHTHPKVKEIIVKDFMHLAENVADMKGYDACFFCAGISSVGMKEEDYYKITYEITLHFAKTLVSQNPNMVFDYVSGASTDSTEVGKVMWARVKGKTENDLMKLPFKGVYAFRPGFMKPFKEQKNIKTIFKILIPFVSILIKKKALTLEQVGNAMIKTVNVQKNKSILEIEDIRNY